MGKLYKIKGWDYHFEVAQTRKVVKNPQWVPLPVKHDGKTFRRIMAMPNGLQIYGVWVLIVQVAAKCTPRGVLQDEEGPLTAEDVSIKTGAPESAVREALDVLSSVRIGWLVVEQWERDGSTTGAPYQPEIDAKTQPTIAAVKEDMQIMGARWERDGSALPLQDTTRQDKTGQDNTRQDNGARAPGAAARVGVVVESSAPELTRKDYLAYATDPVAGKGIINPQGWATAQLKNRTQDDEVRAFLRSRGSGVVEAKIEDCPDCHGKGVYYPNGIGVGPVVKCKHPQIRSVS